MALETLVTGGGGILGQKVVGVLRHAGYSTISCGKIPGPTVDTSWDLSNQDKPDLKCNPDTVVHSAAKIGGYQQTLSGAAPLFDINVSGTLRVVNWCASVGVRKLVMISSAAVYGRWDQTSKQECDPVSPWFAGPYAVSKWCGEQTASLANTYGIELTILRLSSLYGREYLQGLIPRLVTEGLDKGEIELNPPFEDAFDLLHVDDAAKTIGASVTSDHSGLWNVGSGKMTTIKELGETCAKYSNARLTFSSSPSDRSARTINWVDDSRARQDLGHTCQISLDDGIGTISESLRSSNNNLLT